MFDRRIMAIRLAGLLLAIVAPALSQTPPSPAVLPGLGLAQHDFFYAGEGKQERMFIVRKGAIVWSYTHPGKGEISDAILLPDGNILFAHQFAVTEITAVWKRKGARVRAAKQVRNSRDGGGAAVTPFCAVPSKVVWNYDAPPGTEIHTAQPVGAHSVVFIQNGDPAKAVVVNKDTGAIEHEFSLPVKNPDRVHGQFRRARLTDAATLLVAHMDLGKAVEYDLNGKALWSVDAPGIWSASPLKNGNVLIAAHNYVREVNHKTETVWEFKPADAPGFQLANLQTATRLNNGNTLINEWFNEWSGNVDPSSAPVQAIEVTPDKKIVWALRSWMPPADLGPSTTIQILAP